MYMLCSYNFSYLMLYTNVLFCVNFENNLLSYFENNLLCYFRLPFFTNNITFDKFDSIYSCTLFN